MHTKPSFMSCDGSETKRWLNTLIIDLSRKNTLKAEETRVRLSLESNSGGRITQVDLILDKDKVKSANGKRRSNPFSCRVPPPFFYHTPFPHNVRRSC